MTTKTSDIRIASDKLPKEKFLDKIKSSTLQQGNYATNPIIIDEQYLENFERLCHILNSVMVMYAYNFIRDVRLHQLYQLDSELNEILLMTDGVPYEVGMYKLNLLFDQNAHPRISEINCQHPLKGWLQSSYLNQAISEVASSVNSNWNGIQNQSDFLNEIDNQFDHDEILYIIKKDKNNISDDEIQELKNKGINARCVEPNEFTISDEHVKIGKEISRQYLLDLNREELKLFDKEVLKKIVQSGRCLNDVRTIILMHDRKMLAGLNNREIMGTYINVDDFEFLSAYLVPSYTINNEQDKEHLINSDTVWVLRENDDQNTIHIRSNYSPEEWKEIVLNNFKNCMAQPYIQQKEFTISSDDQEIKTNLSGTNLCFNARSFGSGIFKTSEESIQHPLKEPIFIPAVVEKQPKKYVSQQLQVSL